MIPVMLVVVLIIVAACGIVKTSQSEGALDDVKFGKRGL